VALYSRRKLRLILPLLIGVLISFFYLLTKNNNASSPSQDGLKNRLVERESSASPNSVAPSPAGVEFSSVTPRDRREWAIVLEKSGVEVGWDEKTGTPFSLRHPGLGTQPLHGQAGQNVFTGGYGDRALAVMNNLAPVFGLRDAPAELKPSGREETDDLGFRHQRLGQMYAGLPVVGGDLKVHFDAQGIPYEVSGRFVPGIDLNTRPVISAGESEESAKRAFAAEANSLDGLQVHEPAALVVLAVDQAPVLAYQLAVSSTPANAWRYWVDAQSGQVIRRVAQVCSIQAPTSRGTSVQLRGMKLPNEGGAYTTFSGWRENGVYYMYDPASYTYVFNCNNTTSLSNNLANITNDLGTYAYRTTVNWANTDPTEVSTAANMITILSYYKNIHNRRGVDGQGTVVPAYVHYDANYENAFWSFQYKAMFYGDGGVGTYPFCVLEVAGHELTHGITQYTAGLIYENESGALNESFSDIFGTNIEFYGQTDMSSRYPDRVPGTADWLLGEDLVKVGVAGRDMRSPGNTNTVTDPQPSKYKGTNWTPYTNNPTSKNDQGGVHNNSGVQNHFYYLLCQGGNSNNNGIPYNLTGIGINNARQIAYRALTVYCASNTVYSGARAAWISAATDLNPAWTASVSAAWNAVGVGASSPSGGGGGGTGSGVPNSFAAAETITGRFFNATVGGSKIGSSGQTFWWKWTAPATGRLQLDTSRSSAGVATVLQAYSVSNTVVTNNGTVTTNSSYRTPATYSNSVASPSVTWSQLGFGVTKGEIYAFAVSGIKAGQDLVLSGSLAAQSGPANDFIAAATEKTGIRWVERGSNFNATAESGEPAFVTTTANLPASQSVWFKWKAPENQTVTLSTAGSATDTVLAVYTVLYPTSTSPIYSKVALNDDLKTTDRTSQVRFGANKGTTYYIVVDSKNNQTGPYVLELR